MKIFKNNFIISTMSIKQNMNKWAIITSIQVTKNNKLKAFFSNNSSILYDNNKVESNIVFEHNNITVNFQGKNHSKNLFSYIVESKKYLFPYEIQCENLLKVFCLSKDSKSLLFSDDSNVKILSLKTCKIETLKNISNVIFMKHISTQYIVCCSKTNIYMIDLKYRTCLDLNFSKFSKKNIKDIYICDKYSFKIGLEDGSICFFKNNEFSYIRKIHSQYGNYENGKFSENGKMLILSFSQDDGTRTQIIHENATIEDDNICFIEDVNNCFCTCRDSKILVTCTGKQIKIYNISCIGNLKRMQCLEFIFGMNQRRESILSVFFKHRLFDINVVKIIFSFLPYSTSNFNVKKLN